MFVRTRPGLCLVWARGMRLVARATRNASYPPAASSLVLSCFLARVDRDLLVCLNRVRLSPRDLATTQFRFCLVSPGKGMTDLFVCQSPNSELNRAG